MEKKTFQEQIMAAQSAEEVLQILHENDPEYDLSQAEDIFSRITDLADRKLSEDELDAVSGGAEHRDYATEGCAATVEPRSDCWGTDGGCIAININYAHRPRSERCPRCGAYTYYLAVQDPYSDCDSMFGCRSCGLYAKGFDIYVFPFWKEEKYKPRNPNADIL